VREVRTLSGHTEQVKPRRPEFLADTPSHSDTSMFFFLLLQMQIADRLHANFIQGDPLRS